MELIGASEARNRLPGLLDRVARGESLTITRHGKPVARLVPVKSELAREVVARIADRRRHLRGAPLAELVESNHEGHRY